MEIEDIVAADAQRIADIKEYAKGKSIPSELLPFLIVRGHDTETAFEAIDSWVNDQYVEFPGELILGAKKG